MQEVEIKVSKDGQKIEMDAIGFKGGLCKDFMAKTIQALGKVEEEKKKPEYFAHTGNTINSGVG